jgi:hypothetical protein
MNQISSPTGNFICVAAAKGEYRNDKSTKRGMVTSSYPIGRNWYSILLLTIQGFASHLRWVQAPFASLIHNNEDIFISESYVTCIRLKPQPGHHESGQLAPPRALCLAKKFNLKRLKRFFICGGPVDA